MKQLLFCLALIMYGTSSYAATKSIEVQFEYPSPAQAFNLYMDGKQVCNTNTTEVMSCTDIEIPYGVHRDTLWCASVHYDCCS